MKYKVLLDTNVLVSASICLTLEGSKPPILLKHPFFDNCMNLLGLLRKHVPKRIGLLTTTVENEASRVIEHAIEIEIEKSKLPRDQLFATLSLVLTRCQDRMQELMQILQREPIRSEDVSPYLRRVTGMYDEFIRQAEAIDLKSETEIKTATASPGFKSVAHRVYRNQGVMLNRQVRQLRFDRPDEDDKLIISEAAYLSSLYKEREGKIEFFLASSDTHFSPMAGTGGGLVSRDVTDRIFREFGVSCDWPLEVAKTLRENLK